VISYISLLYTIVILVVQLVFCLLLYRLTRDRLTWGLLIIGSVFSITARLLIIDYPKIFSDYLIAGAITINTFGFIALYRLLKTLNYTKKTVEKAKF